jgi:peptidoglycan/xylan/chitin deacetylase (PgdA/CDA1 family)
MRKLETWAGAGALAGGLVALGGAVDRRAGAFPVATLVGTAVAATYLVGTFVPSARVFGSSVSPGGDASTIALTFDDGPDPRHTPAISRELADRGHRATFFVLARAVDAYPEIAAQVLADGHELASHGVDHELLAFATPKEVRRQLTLTEDSVACATGSPPAKLFRPPHGVRSPWLTGVARRCGYRVCAWDGRVFDTARPGVDVIVDRVARLLAPGAIVLLHDGDGSGNGDSRSQTVEALPAILDRAEMRGLRSVAVSALAA